MTDESIRALAHPLRAGILRLLAIEQLCTCHLVDLTGARQTNVSNHLRVLREAGLIVSEPCGRYTYHRVRPEAMEVLAAEVTHLAEQARAAQTIRRPCP